VRLGEDTAEEEAIGRRDLTQWPSAGGRLLVRLVLRLARNVSAYAVFYATAAIGALVFLGLTTAGAEVYESVAEREGIAGLDRPVLDQAIALRTPTNVAVWTAFTHLGSVAGMTLIATTVTLLMVWAWRSRTPLVLMVVAASVSAAMTGVGKEAVGRPRPPLADAVPPYEYAFSFPSGHALNSTVISGTVAYLLLRRLRSTSARVVTVVGAVVWSVAMGISRIFLGHHWLTDVVFAWLLGLAWLSLVITAHRLFLTVRRARRAARE